MKPTCAGSTDFLRTLCCEPNRWTGGCGKKDERRPPTTLVRLLCADRCRLPKRGNQSDQLTTRAGHQLPTQRTAEKHNPRCRGSQVRSFSTPDPPNGTLARPCASNRRVPIPRGRVSWYKSTVLGLVHRPTQSHRNCTRRTALAPGSSVHSGCDQGDHYIDHPTCFCVTA
jgi:hypothetical protein